MRRLRPTSCIDASAYRTGCTEDGYCTPEKSALRYCLLWFHHFHHSSPASQVKVVLHCAPHNGQGFIAGMRCMQGTVAPACIGMVASHHGRGIIPKAADSGASERTLRQAHPCRSAHHGKAQPFAEKPTAGDDSLPPLPCGHTRYDQKPAGRMPAQREDPVNPTTGALAWNPPPKMPAADSSTLSNRRRERCHCFSGPPGSLPTKAGWNTASGL
jgi:hypothetical protein